MQQARALNGIVRGILGPFARIECGHFVNDRRRTPRAHHIAAIRLSVFFGVGESSRVVAICRVDFRDKET